MPPGGDNATHIPATDAELNKMKIIPWQIRMWHCVAAAE